MPGKKKIQSNNRSNLQNAESDNQDKRDIVRHMHVNVGSNEANQKEPRNNNGAVVDQNGPAPQNHAEEDIQFDLDGLDVPDNQLNDHLINNADNQAPQANNAPAPNNRFIAKKKPRTEWSRASELNNGLWRFVGNSLGKLSVLPLSVAGKVTYITPGIKNNAQKKAEAGQKQRNHKVIPGRDGETFDPQKDNGKDVLDDFRRIPTVWSYITAGKAVDADQKYIPPKVTVYVQQPKAGSSRSMSFRQLGHTMLGIEYTRRSKITGKPERYNIKYGFYPAGGVGGVVGTAMMLKGAIVPGQLINDASHEYDISKSYTTGRKNIEKIAKASESYTEKGGYGFYTRNCTTFVRDMFKAGQIGDDGTIEKIFTNEKVRFNSGGNAGLVFVNAWNGFFDTSMQQNLGKLTEANDRSYQGWGNKRVTKEDFDRYRKTKNTAGYGVTSLAPASAGENMRRMTDDKGQLGSYAYAPDAIRKDPKDNAGKVNPDLSELRVGIQTEGKKLYRKIGEIMTGEQREAAGSDFCAWYSKLEKSGNGTFMARFVNKCNRTYAGLVGKGKNGENIHIADLCDASDLKMVHEEISGEIAVTSRMYQNVLHSDSRLNTEVMNLLSSLQIALRVFDEAYEDLPKNYDARSELGSLRKDMFWLNDKTISFNGVTVQMSPTHYESYLQIYRTPEAAVNAYSRYLELRGAGRADDKKKKKWGDKTQKELNSLQRNEELAKQLDMSHRDMVEKGDFTQGDIDYAFRLRKMERTGKAKAGAVVRAEGDMYDDNATASMTYIAIFFDKIFSGIVNNANKAEGDGGLPDDLNQDHSIQWLNDYLTTKARTRENANMLTMILRGILRTYTMPSAADIKFSFNHFLLNAYLKRVFPTKRRPYKIRTFGMMLENAYNTITKDGSQMSFATIINNLTRLVMMENAATMQLERGQRKTGQRK